MVALWGLGSGNRHETSLSKKLSVPLMTNAARHCGNQCIPCTKSTRPFGHLTALGSQRDEDLKERCRDAALHYSVQTADRAPFASPASGATFVISRS